MKILFLLLFSVCVTTGEEKPPKEPKPVKITAKTVIGKVSFLRPPSNRRQTIRLGTILRKNDVVYTEVESRVELVFESGSVITVEENSLVKVEDLAESEKRTRVSIKLRAGKVLFDIQRLVAKGSLFEFKTEAILAGIRGTKGGIGSWGDKTLAYLESGSLQLMPLKDDNFVTLEPMNVAIGAVDGIDVTKYSDPKEFQLAVMEAEKELKKMAKSGDAMRKALNDFKNDRKTRHKKKKVKNKPSDKQLFYPVDE